jgi:uncharacterized protein YkwD
MRRRLLLALVLLAAAAAALAAPAGAMEVARLIAPVSACEGQGDAGAPTAVQEQTMRCLANYARERAGLGPLADASDLDRSAHDKSDDILRCDSFSHYACGRQFTYWMERVGYTSASCWRAGENLAWGTGEYGSPGEIFRSWMQSPDHRENILGPYRQVGIALVVGGLDGEADVHVWTQHFGSHCDQPDEPSSAPRLAELAEARIAG